MTGFKIGKWIRFRRKWPYKEMPQGSIFIFYDIAEGYRAAAMAYKWGRKNGVKFTSRKTRSGIEIIKEY